MWRATQSPVSARSHAITGESLCSGSIDTARLIDWAKSSKSFLFGRSAVKAELFIDSKPPRREQKEDDPRSQSPCFEWARSVPLVSEISLFSFPSELPHVRDLSVCVCVCVCVRIVWYCFYCQCEQMWKSDTIPVISRLPRPPESFLWRGLGMVFAWKVQRMWCVLPLFHISY